MSRGLNATNVTAATAAHVRPIVFLELQFDSGTLRLHNAVGSMTWGGNTWLGIGALGEIAPHEESDDPSPYRISYRLNGLNSTILQEALAEEVFERLAIRYDGFIGADGALVADPDETRRDFMDTMEIIRGDEMDSVMLNCESELVRDSQAPGGMFTDEDQQALYSGDTGFQYLAQIVAGADGVRWGPGGVAVRFGADPTPNTAPRRPPRNPSTQLR
jgi:hypothetical protein